jgi:leader peptidase (prepilin peptidase)/N-methyltransferase
MEEIPGKEGTMVFWIGVLLGGGGGEILRRHLNRLTYRVVWSDDDGAVNERLFADPGPRWWIPAVLGVSWGVTMTLVETAGTIEGWVHLMGWLTFCVLGLWLAAIDIDVRRLPDRGQLLLAATSVVAGVGISWSHPRALLVALGLALGCGLGFLVAHMVSRGGLGLGDVKLVMTCAWWLALISPGVVFHGLFVSCLLAIGFSLTRRVREFAFGPHLVAGTFLAGVVLTNLR